MLAKSAVVVVTLVAALFVFSCSGKKAEEAPPVAVGPPEIDKVTPLPSPFPEVVARVNGVAVPRLPVLALAARGLQGSTNREADLPGAVRSAVNQYVVRELLLQEAVARGIAPKQGTVDAAFDSARASVKDEKEWAQKLGAEGLDPATYRDELRAQLTVSALLAKVDEEVPTPSEQEASAFYAANPALFWRAEVFKMSRILVAVEEGAGEEQRTKARARADSLAARVKPGASFQALAKESSDDAEAKKTGGLMPAFSRGQGPPAVEEALLAMKPGETSGALVTPAGFEIVLLHERSDGRAVPFEEIKAQVLEAVRRRASGTRWQELVNALRAKAKIETYV